MRFNVRNSISKTESKTLSKLKRVSKIWSQNRTRNETRNGLNTASIRPQNGLKTFTVIIPIAATSVLTPTTMMSFIIVKRATPSSTDSSSCQILHLPTFTGTNSWPSLKGLRCGIRTLPEGSSAMSRSSILVTYKKGLHPHVQFHSQE